MNIKDIMKGQRKMSRINKTLFLIIMGIISVAQRGNMSMLRQIELPKSIIYLADDTGAEFVLDRVEPRIFTPEEENTNINKVRFYFNGTDYYGEVIIRIYDREGREIRGSLELETANIMVWDGRDGNNKIVDGGIYIYQVEADGKILNGTIVVAK
jgi:hypothetical protein